VSEGITDYYADVALVRAGVIDSTEFLALTAGKMQNVADVPEVSLEDASLSAWIGVTDGTGYIYYPKGSLAGMLLDIRIRAATGNRKSLDDVMRSVYRSTYEKGRGFTAKDWWGAVTEAAGGVSFDEFDARYIDGREPFPYATDFAMAGLTAVVDRNRVARLGIQSSSDSTTVVVAVTPGSAFAEAGGLVGDELVSVGDFKTSESSWAEQFRGRYGKDPEGSMIPAVVRRGGQRLTLQMPLRFVTIVSYRLVVDPTASPSAVQVRQGIMTGSVAK
jgi:predicted metalloprotease with PDZ domain